MLGLVSITPQNQWICATHSHSFGGGVTTPGLGITGAEFVYVYFTDSNHSRRFLATVSKVMVQKRGWGAFVVLELDHLWV